MVDPRKLTIIGIEQDLNHEQIITKGLQACENYDTLTPKQKDAVLFNLLRVCLVLLKRSGALENM